MIAKGLNVRKATIDDAERLLEINRNSIFDIDDFLYSTETKKAWAIQNLEDMQSIIKSEKYYTIVASIQNQIVGFATCKSNQLRLLYVDPKHQQKGVATTLLQQSEKILKKPYSIKISKNSVPFYQKHGYKIQCKSKTILNNKPISTFIVYKG